MRPYTPFDKILDLKDKELRKTKHALWMARAMRAICELDYWNKVFEHSEDYTDRHGNDMNKEYCCNMIQKWKWAERKCREKAKEFE